MPKPNNSEDWRGGDKTGILGVMYFWMVPDFISRMPNLNFKTSLLKPYTLPCLTNCRGGVVYIQGRGKMFRNDKMGRGRVI